MWKTFFHGNSDFFCCKSQKATLDRTLLTCSSRATCGYVHQGRFFRLRRFIVKLFQEKCEFSAPFYFWLYKIIIVLMSHGYLWWACRTHSRGQMAHSYYKLFFHLVWHTKNNLPYIEGKTKVLVFNHTCTEPAEV